MCSDSSRKQADGLIDRRDFVGMSLVGAGAALLSQAAPGALFAGTSKPAHPVGMTGLTASWTGPGGAGDYAQANGNTHVTVNRAHGLIRNHELDARIAAAERDADEYDLIIVGAGISGLTAAYQYRKDKPGARILILELADMPGGTAKQNEFDVDGHHLWGKQGSSAVGSILPGGQFMPWHPFYLELGLPMQFTYRQPQGLSQDILFPTDDWTPMWPNYKGADVGYYFEGHGWIKNPWNNGFADAPIPDGLKRDLMKMANLWRVPYRKDWKQYLDGMSYQEWWVKTAGIDPDALWLAEGETRGALAGLGPDAISGRDIVDSYYMHHESLTDFGPPNPFSLVTSVSRAVELPGGNATIARRLLYKLIPDSYPGAESFGAFLRARLNREALDRPGQAIRLRLNSPVVSVVHAGNPKTAKAVEVVYSRGGDKLVRVRGKSVIVAGQQHSNKSICHDLPADYIAAMGEFAHAPILTVNVAVRHWRFLDKLGISYARWFGGFGWWTGVPMNYLIDGQEWVPNHPDKPVVLTMFIPFLKYRNRPPEEQARLARLEMFAMSFADIEQGVRQQFTKMFGDHGFNADRDIAAITANRWGHAYVVQKPGFNTGKNGAPSPSNVLRQGFNRIGFAHTELAGTQLWSNAVIEATRAAKAAAALA